MKNKMKIYSHPLFLKHGILNHPENKNRLESILSAIQASPLQPYLHLSLERMATREELTLIHSPSYVDHVFSLDGQAVALDPETFLSEHSVKAARLAAGLGLELVGSILEGSIENGALLCRPPGHHARTSESLGFCVFNNIAIAAQFALNQGIQRILILDWDVHHGNGTQEAFYDTDRVLFIDLHQENLFPVGSGALNQRGKGSGFGYTVNIPLPHSCRDADYLYILDQLVLPLARRYKPDLILVSAGYDAHETDPLGSMYLTSSGYEQMTQRIRSLANSLCQGKVALFLEGGYEPNALAQNVLQCVSALIHRSDLAPLVTEPHHTEVADTIRTIDAHSFN